MGFYFGSCGNHVKVWHSHPYCTKTKTLLFTTFLFQRQNVRHWGEIPLEAVQVDSEFVAPKQVEKQPNKYFWFLTEKNVFRWLRWLDKLK